MMEPREPGDGHPSSAGQHLAAEIRRRRKAAGFSQPRLAGEIGYSRQYLSRAENPHQGVPSLELVQAIDRCLGANGELVELRRVAQREAYAIRNSLGSGEDEDVKRRTLLGLGSVALTSQMIGKLEEVRSGLNDIIPAQPSDRDADDWEQAVDTYAHEVGSVPAAQLLSDLVADFTEIKLRITESHGLVRMRLIHSGTQLAALTAISLLNLSERRSAERWWRTASRAAEESADPELAALMSGRQAVFSLHLAPPPRVLSLAEAAVARGGHAPCVGAISGLAARAQTLSELGRHQEASVTLHHVTDMFARLPDAALADQQSQWNWAEQRLRHVESHVHAYAGRVDQAQEAQQAAWLCYPAGNFQGRTQVAMHQAVALFRSGDIKAGADHLIAIIEKLPLWQRSDGIVLRSAKAALGAVPPAQRQHLSVAPVADMIRSVI